MCSVCTHIQLILCFFSLQRGIELGLIAWRETVLSPLIKMGSWVTVTHLRVKASHGGKSLHTTNYTVIEVR